MVVDCTDPRQEQGVGDQDNVTSIPFQKTKRKIIGRLSCKAKEDGKEDTDTDALTIRAKSITCSPFSLGK